MRNPQVFLFDELYDRPANLFVADFIGSRAVNCLQGKSEGSAFRAASSEALPLPGRPNGSDDRPAVYGVRPEHFQLNPSGLPAIGHVVEPTGFETQVVAEVAGASVVCAFRGANLRQARRDAPHHTRSGAGAIGADPSG